MTSLAEPVTLQDSEPDAKAKQEDYVDKQSKKSSKFSDSELGVMISIVRKKMTPGILKGEYKLVAEKDALNWSLGAVRFGVLADACSTTILQPNFPFIALPGAHPDSFPNTDPFGFSSATYFLPMTALLASAITSAFVGSLSDRIGRRPCMLACIGVSVFLTLVKYFARETFWGFCAANFANGLFGASLPAALAYVSDVHPNRHKKDAEIGALIGFNMIGMSGGGISAILMEDQGLFAPLFIGAAMNALAFVFLYLFMHEADARYHFDEEPDEDEGEAPEKINWSLFMNVNVGALLDNIGSTGLYPLTLAPLAFETFYADFALTGESPIMSDVVYKWIAVMVALMVIPGAIMSQSLFDRIGAPGGCVLGNSLTAIGIFGCLYICRINPPTTKTMTGYIILLYGIFPLTVLSQLSTGPMLDRLSPVDKRGFSQGVNITIMNFANAFAPWIFGEFSDNAGISTTLWTAIGISLLAAVVNLPLTCAPELKVKEKLDYQQANGLEDHELVERAIKGEWVPAKFLDDLNDARLRKGLPFLNTPVHEYEEDKEHLQELRKHAREDFEYHRNRAYMWLAEMDSAEKRAEIVKMVNKSMPSASEAEKSAEDLGRWFGEYLKDAGYFFDGGASTMYKQMFMKAFPVLNKDHEITPENTEEIILRFVKLANDYLDSDRSKSAANAAFRNSMVY